MAIYLLTDEVGFPDPNLASDDGLLAMGGDLSPERLILAYASGIFPWYSEGEPILWWSPNPRMVVIPEKFKASKSLRQLIHRKTFELKIDTQFEQVIHECAKMERENQEDTWITPEMEAAYLKLHKAGFAHSFETYLQGELVGGLYGISIGKAFFGESMFHQVSNASKVAYYHLVQFALQHDFQVIDAQQETDHLKSLGGELMERSDFLSLLDQVIASPTIRGSWRSKI